MIIQSRGPERDGSAASHGTHNGGQQQRISKHTVNTRQGGTISQPYACLLAKGSTSR